MSVGPISRGVLGAATLALVAYLVRFYRRQQRSGELGGRMAPAKAFWLGFAVFSWFVLPAVLALDAAVPLPFRWVLGVFAVSMWLRGVAEMVMLYAFKNWRPPYGIGHDLLSIGILAVGTAWQWASVQTLLVAPRQAGMSVWLVALLGVLTLSLALEVAYAYAFFAVVRGKTVGDDGIWFASNDDPLFRRIVWTTACFNWPLYAFNGALLWVLFGG